jgi:hypothetical protein
VACNIVTRTGVKALRSFGERQGRIRRLCEPIFRLHACGPCFRLISKSARDVEDLMKWDCNAGSSWGIETTFPGISDSTLVYLAPHRVVVYGTQSPERHPAYARTLGYIHQNGRWNLRVEGGSGQF